MELSSYFRINARNTGQFERTLIIADDDSYVSYLEGCTAPMRDENQLHAAIVEIVVKDNAEVKYSTVQNWYPGDEKGKGGVLNLGLALGFDEETLDSIVPITKMRKLVEERTGANEVNKFFKINPKVDDIPDTYSKEVNGVKLLVLGTVETGGGGCVCPEHVMLRRIINNLVIHRDDVVIMTIRSELVDCRCD